MKQLFEIDLHDYNQDSKIFRRPSARAIIIQKNKIALVYSQKEKYYKFPGGGIGINEDAHSALVREVREEVGLIVIPDSITEFGSVMRRQRSNVTPDTIFEQENFYFFFRTQDLITKQELDDYEKEAGFVLRLVDINDAIQVNRNYRSDDFFNEIMIRREMMVLQMVSDYLAEINAVNA